MPQSVIVTPEKANALIGKEANTRNVIYINVLDDSKISQVNRKISEMEEDLEIQQIVGSTELDEMVSGLTSAFFVVFAVVRIKVNNKDSGATVFGYEGFKMFDGIKGLPETLEKEQVILDKAMLERLDISVGEKIEITLKANSIRPVNLQLTVVGSCDSVYYNMQCNAMLLNMEDYKQVYHDYPFVLLLETDKENISQQLKNQFVDKEADFKTAEEYYEQKEQESSSITSVLNALIFLGIALAVISVIGNQSIGFEQRKREFAVLYSAGMSRRQLIQMIITELAALAVVSTIISVLSGTVIVKSLSWLLVVLELSIPVFFYVDEILIFIAVLFAVIMFTGMIPVRALLKMNTSKQLKYE